MSANRKLQSEVDKVLKKVDEGVEVFDEIWDKVYAATQQSLKEKYESDLKKEIKKLQRLRDQIKTWASSSDIKDKSNLLDAKKLIENKMEQFKICEKETKTKAYSKEGLAREEKLDPHEAEKEQSRSWVQGIIEKLQNSVESWEADIERISNSKGKNKNKDQINRLETKVAKNRWHMKMLEQINRLISNDSLEVEKLNDIKEDIEYYVECMENDESDGIDDDYDIYEELQLESLSGRGPPHSVNGNGSSTDKDKSGDHDSSSTASSSSSSSSSKQGASKSSSTGGPSIGNKKAIPSSSTASILASISPAKTTKTQKASGKSTAKQPSTSNVASTSTSANSAPSASSSEGPTTTAWANPASSNQRSASTGSSASASQSLSTTSNSAPTPSTTASKTGKTSQATQPTAAQVAAAAMTKPSAQDPRQQPASSKETNNQLVGESLSRTSTPVISGPKQSSESTDQRSQPAPFMQPFSLQPSSISSHPSSSLSGVTSASTESATVSESKSQPPMISHEMQTISNLLKMSMINAPPSNDSADSRMKGSAPKNPYNTHPAFPTIVPSVLESANTFERLPMDSLFLAFYYQQGSYQQYLAAQQLKKSSWRFHKKYMTWFQRHEEPKVTTDEYEEGTYVYFDYESGWCQRIKSEFKFEYCYLEDELTQAEVS